MTPDVRWYEIVLWLGIIFVLPILLFEALSPPAAFIVWAGIGAILGKHQSRG